jgi:betaine reductase
MDHAVIKGVGHLLVHCPSLVIYGHAPQEELEKRKKGMSLDPIFSHLRKYKDVVNYLPNQVYIGNLEPEQMKNYKTPWWDKKNILVKSDRYGIFGEIIPQDEFFALMKIVDVFDLIWLNKSFIFSIKKKLQKHSLFSFSDIAKLGEGKEKEEIKIEIKQNKALPFKKGGEIVGCVRYAHKSDTNLSANIILENLVSKASASLALKYALRNANLNSEKIEYIIECSEEAIGDAFQRGGGNLAKSIGEVVGCNNAIGSDLRAFCAAPIYGMLTAASHVVADTFKEIAVVAGGSLPKLGMNFKKHLEKNMPILEDTIAALAIIIGEDDQKNPIIINEVCGRHIISKKSSPQEVMKALISEPLTKMKRKIVDIDKFAAELHNPEILIPAGAGDVAQSNYRMIAALAVMRNEIERGEINKFVQQKGMIGFVPTQGHIPSGVSFVGFAQKMILENKINNALIIGKGSLFLGRMTNLFDGISLLLKKNDYQESIDKKSKEIKPEKKLKENKKIKIGISTFGYEYNLEELIVACKEVSNYEDWIDPVIISKDKIPSGESFNSILNKLIDSRKIDGALAMHYTFDKGMASVGKIISPYNGKVLYLATTTGYSASQRIETLIKNAIAGIAVAKTDGILDVKVGLLNLEGSLVAKRALDELVSNGYPINWVTSLRKNQGELLRGNDLLSGEVDVVITDSLTGNILVKILSAYTTGGKKEILGYGYGPGVGEGMQRVVNIISRASGEPVIINAIKFTAEMVRSNLIDKYKSEIKKAYECGLKGIIEKYCLSTSSNITSLPFRSNNLKKKVPIRTVLNEEIEGVDIIEIENAVSYLLKNSIYVVSGMGCTGAVIMLNKKDKEKAIDILKEEGFLK